MDELGERLGFATSVLHQRGLLGPNEPVAVGEPRHPLLTWPFLDYLESLDLSKEQLIELGAGHSTFWFGARFNQKTGIWLSDPLGKSLEGAPVSKDTRMEWLRWLNGEPIEKTKFERPKFEC